MADGEAPDSGLRDKLIAERNALLDLSTRNRLLNVPLRTRNVRTIEIVDEKAAEIHRLLCESRALTFVPGRQLTAEERADLEPEDVETGGLPQPDDDAVDARGVAARHADTKLQTKLTSEGLQKRLFDVWYDARTLEEEQGVNILYLALGLLRWYDSDSSEIARHAPLVLMPVSLERTSAADKFKLKGRGEPASGNLTLQAKLRGEFNLLIDDLSEDEAVDIAGYMAKVAATISGQKRWEVLPDAMVLGFFSFAKFLMYRDLDPANWSGAQGSIDSHPLVSALLRDGFPVSSGLTPEDDFDAKIDALIPPSAQHHVVDADSSQSVVVQEAAGGRTMVVRGPPGTGKSQTITNIIAAAAGSGRKVLFVAEKMAALEVVHRRLRTAGLGALLLELHSNKANKKAVLDEMRRTRELSVRPPRGDATVLQQLTERRNQLNAHDEQLNTPLEPFGLTAQQVLGHLVRVRERGGPEGYGLIAPETWTPHDRAEREALVAELSERAARLGDLAQHPWRGVEREAMDPSELESLAAKIAAARSLLPPVREALGLAAELRGEAAGGFSQLPQALATLRAAATRPPADREALRHALWGAAPRTLAELVSAARRRLDTREDVVALFVAERDLRLKRLSAALDRAINAAETAEALTGEPAGTIGDLPRAVAVLTAATAMPTGDRSALAHPAWRTDVQALRQTVEAGRLHVKTRTAIADRFTQAAWTIDPRPIRRAIESKGASLFRFLDRAYRAEIARLKAALRGPAPSGSGERIALLDQLAAAQDAKETFDRQAPRIAPAFGSDWRGEDTDFARLDASVTWRETHADQPVGFWASMAATDPDHLTAAYADAVHAERKLGGHVEHLSLLLRSEDHAALAAPSSIPLKSWRDQLDGWRTDTVLPLQWIAVAQSGRDGLRKTLGAALPPGAAEQGRMLDSLLAAHEAERAYEAALPAADAFGADWRGEDSDFGLLQALVEWRAEGETLPPSFWAALADADPDRVSSALANLEAIGPQAAAAVSELTNVLSLSAPLAFATEDWSEVPVARLEERLAAWSEQSEGVTRWIAFTERGRAAERLGLGALVRGVTTGRLAPGDLQPGFERAYYEALRTEVFRRAPGLRGFDGELQDRLVAEFRRLDQQRMALSREHIAAKHAEERPRGAAGVGPLGRLTEEFAKKRNLLPIRRLLEVAGPAIQQIKPVFMMSPLSVAQFLKPGAIAFDLLVIDEASQVEPVDALGAIARARQMVVVGDERQLPPTRFFAKLTSDDAERGEEDATFATKDAESILELCLAKGAPARMLNWHYRSKHQSLIAVSNRQFYDNKLFIVPSPYDAVAGMGLQFNHLPHAVYDRGNTRTNPIEADAIVTAVIAHARDNPGQSLGVATFSTSQRGAILKRLELARREHPELEPYFAAGGPEPFFVKNLENVQGDERDVIFISVGYGKDASGYLMMNFGPLSGEGGERRLNVLISRAKLRCEVFSSVQGDDIDLERARSRGVAALKMFLKFAETGKFTTAEATGRGHDSVFEEEVARKLADRGHEVRAQIGAAGFFIDLAIADAEKPGRFVLGIECDGAQYHSARSARDRDRLRQQVLEAHGWVIHRIWSADWFLRPEEELAKVERAISEAKAIWRERDAETASAAPKLAVPVQFTTSIVDDDTELVTAHLGEPMQEPFRAASVTPISTPYREAVFAVDRSTEPHETPLSTMVDYVVEVVDAEGPVHEDEVVARIRSLWGLGRAGSRIRAAVGRALAAAQGRGLVEGGPFYSRPGGQLAVRNRSQVAASSLRKAEMLPPAEIEATLAAIVAQNYGAEREELLTAAARALGFASTSSLLRTALGRGVDALIASGKLSEDGGVLVAAEPANERPPP